MPSPGFVYVLINPAMPGLVKVGHTARDVERRASELSASTGVPSPFIVIYEQFFVDSLTAEAYVHQDLSAKGYRLTANREFFSAPSKAVIDSVRSAPGATSPHEERVEEPEWLKALFESDNLHGRASKERYWTEGLKYYEVDDDLTAQVAAKRFFEEAAALGHCNSSLLLSRMAASNKSERHHHILRGATNGDVSCWIMLADHYLETNQWFLFSTAWDGYCHLVLTLSDIGFPFLWQERGQSMLNIARRHMEFRMFVPNLGALVLAFNAVMMPLDLYCQNSASKEDIEVYEWLYDQMKETSPDPGLGDRLRQLALGKLAENLA